EDVLDAVSRGRLVNIALETAHWYQNLVLHPRQTLAFCAPLVRQALAEVDALLAAAGWAGRRLGADAVLLTASAGRLPGLGEALQDRFDECGGGRAAVTVLPADAVAATA